MGLRQLLCLRRIQYNCHQSLSHKGRKLYLFKFIYYLFNLVEEKCFRVKIKWR